MKKKKPEPDFPIGKLKRVDDFLPPPDELVLPQDTIKVTIALNRLSVEFFKAMARQHRTKYQKMIRELLDCYVRRYQKV